MTRDSTRGEKYQDHPVTFDPQTADIPSISCRPSRFEVYEAAPSSTWRPITTPRCRGDVLSIPVDHQTWQDPVVFNGYSINALSPQQNRCRRIDAVPYIWAGRFMSWKTKPAAGTSRSFLTCFRLMITESFCRAMFSASDGGTRCRSQNISLFRRGSEGNAGCLLYRRSRRGTSHNTVAASTTCP